MLNLFRRRNSMSWLLQRQDDRLLDDIGLTRADLERMLREDSPAQHPTPDRPQAVRCTA